MAGQIYKAFQVSFSEAWYRLSKDEQQGILAKVNQAREQVGGKTVALCDSSWTSEEWEFFGLEVYPSIEAVQKHAELLKAFDWARYHTHRSLVGTETAV